MILPLNTVASMRVRVTTGESADARESVLRKGARCAHIPLERAWEGTMFGIGRSHRLYCSILALVALHFVTGAARAGGCAKSERDGLTSYLCQIDSQGSAPAFRLAFHSLSEAVIGDLLTNTEGHIVSKVLGHPRLIETSTGTELAELYKTFGTSETLQSAFFVRMSKSEAAEGDKTAEPGMGEYGEGTRRMTYITNPDTEGLVQMDFPLPDTVQKIQNDVEWPSDLKLFYACDPNDSYDPNADPSMFFSCFTPWRYMAAADTSSYADNLRRYRAMIKDDYKRQYYENPDPKVIRYLDLVRHITRNGFPEDFLPIVGTFDICGGSFDFAFYPRLLTLDVAVIENLTGTTLSIQELLGSAFDRADLRPEEESSGGDGAALPVTVGDLAPGERVLIPVRMRFVQSNSLANRFQNMEGAQRFYERVMAEPSDRVFSYADQNVAISKSVETFRAPERPSTSAYIYGAELQITGLVVGGERIDLEGTSANYLELTAGEGYGSCPYLYYWQAERGEWIKYGKVIDAANAPEKARSEVVHLALPATKLRIAENELEIAYIDEVKLVLKLKRGQSIVLESDIQALASVDSAYVILDTHQYIDIDFKLPIGMRAENIISTDARIHGFYRRYSAFPVSRLGAN